MASNPKSAMVVTVGSGSSDKLEETLYAPILKSIREGGWDRIVLLPSQTTQRNAAELEQRLPATTVTIVPLPSVGDENDVDACFAHFDSVIQRLRSDGFAPANLCADFTRGTKAMSAGLVLASIRHDVTQVRYVEGDRDPNRQNNVIPGTERIRTVAPQIATASQWLDRARAFLMDGDFAAVLGILPDLGDRTDAGWPKDLLPVLAAVRAYAGFYSAWDRLDYSAAVLNCEELPKSPPTRWENFQPSETAVEWVLNLARDSPKRGGKPLPTNQSSEMAAHARRVMVDLLANGRRRIQHNQFEDANLRSYRVAEMLGQVRLFEHNLDSSFLDPEHLAVARLQRDLEKKGSSPLGEINSGGKRYLTAAREQTFRLLGRLKDPFAEKLRNIGPDVESRNHSILVHGFDRLEALDAARLDETYNHLETLLREDLGAIAEDWLETAHFHRRFFR